MTDVEIRCAIEEPALLGESPFWHPDEQVLYYCDIAGRELRRHDPATGELRRHRFDTDVACCAPVLGGGLLLAMRSGLWLFDPSRGAMRRLAEPPYDPAHERYNDGKCDAAGRFWCGTVYEPKKPPLAALYCYDRGELNRAAAGVTTSNGLAWSPDGRTMYWSDTPAHVIQALDFDVGSGEISNRRVWKQFAPKAEGQSPGDYGGRPDGAAMDAEGHLWVAMYEGQRLLRIAPDARIVADIALPVRCPTMPCFGGADLKTLYVTSARHNRPAEELASQPWAGGVLALRVEVPGLPANFARLT